MRGRTSSSLMLGAAFAIGSLAGIAGPGSPAAAADEFAPLDSPQRIADTRADGDTVDGDVEGIGTIAGGERLELQVAGRAGIAADAPAAVLNVTALGATESGFVTIHPCDSPLPNAANINYEAGQVIANAVFAKLDPNGKTCIFTSATAHLIVDVTGALPGDAFEPLPSPRRLLDTRSNGEVFDDDADYEKIGRRAGGSTFTLEVAGRAGVAADARSAVLNVTAIRPSDARGFFTLFPCDQPLPLAANLNFIAGQVVANSVIGTLDPNGAICIFTSSETDIVVDVSGTLPTTSYTPLTAPARLYDSRPNGETIDGIAEKTQARRNGTTLELPVGGRAAVPQDATAVVLNVTVLNGRENGFVTVHPRNSDQPNAANLTHRVDEIIANTVVAKLGGGGEICMFTSSYTEMIVDVSGYLAGPAPADTGEPCPMEFPAVRAPGAFGRYDGYHVPGPFQMPVGRYVAEPLNPGDFGVCDAIRDDGSGSFTSNLGSEVIFKNRRLIIDTQPGDAYLLFRPGDDCGPLKPYVPGEGPPTQFPEAGGFHVVGDHIQPGTYSLSGGVCRAETRSSFNGQSNNVNDSADTVFDGDGVEITVLPTDVGVRFSGDCLVTPV